MNISEHAQPEPVQPDQPGSGQPVPGDDDAAVGGFWVSISPRYVIAPDWRPASRRRRWPLAVLALFGIGLVGALAAGAIQSLVSETLWRSVLEEQLSAQGPLAAFMLVVLIAPLSEELVYRLALTAQLRPGLLAVSGLLGAFSLTGPASAVHIVSGSAWAAVAMTGVAIWLAGVLRPQTPEGASGQSRPSWLSRLSRAGRPGLRQRAERWWETHPRWPVWVSVALFGFVHLSNYESSYSLAAWAIAPFVVGPQLWLGAMFVIARVRYGWWVCVTLHSLHNCVVWSVSRSFV